MGDVGSIRRIFDFLETWGLINYSSSASSKPLKWDDEKEMSKSIGMASQSGSAAGANAAAETSGANRESAKRLCNGCKSVCTIACFACDKVNYYFPLWMIANAVACEILDFDKSLTLNIYMKQKVIKMVSP